MRWTARARLQDEALSLPTNAWDGPVTDIEALQVVETRRASTAVQPMAGFGGGAWHGDAQLLVRAEEEGSVAFRVDLTGLEPALELVLFATRAPDFGTVRVGLGDQVLLERLDLYAPVVVPYHR